MASEPDLVDLVHHPEGAAVQLLQGHEVEHGGDTAFSPALVVGRELMQLRAVVELHPDANPILIVLLLSTHTHTHTHRNIFMDIESFRELIHVHFPKYNVSWSIKCMS